jgi:predicted SAM-dependent methyltransferase
VAGAKARLRAQISRVVRNRSLFIRRRAVRAHEYLDLGCGHFPHPGFVNLDWMWNRRIDICWDLGRGIPLPDASLRGIFSEHCIEHLPLETGDLVLAECHRVLRPGGTLRVVVPDGEMYLAGYAAHLAGAAVALPFSEGDGHRGRYTPIMSVNRIFHEHGHRFIYDFETLRTLLEANGFTEIRRCAFGEGRDPKLLIDREARAPESLYVEAVRPPA